ncbi:MAG TPA: hypothetical protein PLV42_04970 [bacterium]|nr:hypothetical protein [bacterium]
MNYRLFFIAAIIVALSAHAVAEVTFEGDVSFGSSYNSNIGRLSFRDLGTMGLTESDNDAFSADLDAFLTLRTGDLFSLEYTLFTAVTPEDISYSFFHHSLAALFSHELEEIDINYGLETGHLLVGFANRLVEPQVFFELFWYAHEQLSYYLNAAGSYAVSLDTDYGYLTAPGFRFETGIYVYPVAGNRSFISMGVGERMFFFGEDDYLVEQESSDPMMPPMSLTVWAQRAFSETYVRLKGKYYYKGFSAEASVRYGFMRYLDADRWEVLPDPFQPPPFPQYEKTKSDHALRLKALFEYRFTDLFSLQAYYAYLRNFSNMGGDTTDYENDRYDQHTTGFMCRFVF